MLTPTRAYVLQCLIFVKVVALCSVLEFGLNVQDILLNVGSRIATWPEQVCLQNVARIPEQNPDYAGERQTTCCYHCSLPFKVY
jgi:hypothetical protein